MKAIVALFLSITLIAVDAEMANACSCEFLSVRSKVRAARAVFVGEVIRVEDSGDSELPVAVTFRVARYWKGKKSSFVTVKTESSICCTCGLQARVGRQFLVYAFPSPGGSLETSLCSSPIVDAAEDEIKALGKGKEIVTSAHRVELAGVIQ